VLISGLALDPRSIQEGLVLLSEELTNQLVILMLLLLKNKKFMSLILKFKFAISNLLVQEFNKGFKLFYIKFKIVLSENFARQIEIFQVSKVIVCPIFCNKTLHNPEPLLSVFEEFNLPLNKRILSKKVLELDLFWVLMPVINVISFFKNHGNPFASNLFIDKVGDVWKATWEYFHKVGSNLKAFLLLDLFFDVFVFEATNLFQELFHYNYNFPLKF
jgi:hypothetical protein